MSAPVDERVTDEVAALEAILLNDLIIKKVNDVPVSVETVIHPSTANDVDQQFVCVTLEVYLIPGYPDISPEVVLRNPRGLDDDLIEGMHKLVKKKLHDCLGLPVVFELIDLVRDYLTECNLPSGNCVICLYGFVQGDVFIKTQCYHHFHNYCLASHLIAGEKYYQEELEKLPNWQQTHAPPYRPSCPVCRSTVNADVEALKSAPPPIDSISDPPFHLTPELKALQRRMSTLLAQQVARGGVVGMGDNGPPPLTITSPSDNDEASTSNEGAKAESLAGARPDSGEPTSAPGSPQAKPPYRGPYRGFNRRGAPGGRGRGRGRGRGGGGGGGGGSAR